jgi:anaerobic magnesium-protoporphyrin IX monomethyl ester cyclase
MKILFTHAYYLSRDKNEQKIMMPYPPLGMLYVSAYLEEKGLINDIFDTTFETEVSLSEYLLENQPEFICIYANMMTKPNVVRLMSFIKSSTQLSKSQIILGGPDIRYNAENYLKHGADFLVIGEGEVTTYELIKALTQNKSVDSVQGIAYRGMSGEIITTPERALLDIDNIPVPARHKIDLEIYLTKMKEAHGFNSINISTMRGCPFGCRWCSKAVFGNTTRRRTPRLVVDEIEIILRQYNFDTIWFVDDVFTLQRKWLTEFANELNLRDIHIRYECITRTDHLTDSDINLLKQSGCYRVWIGAESGSQKILDHMNRKVIIEDVQKAIISVKSAGLQAGTFIMLGYPGEDEYDIQATVKHLKRSDPDLFTITLTYPIKGTELYNEVEIIKPNPDNWEITTDRQHDFKRLFPIQFYNYAIQYTQREIGWDKAIKKGKVFEAIKHKLFSIYARLRMKQFSMS